MTHTQTLTHADGTRGTYTAAPGSDLFLKLAAIKPAKPPRPKADKRTYPKWVPGMSVATYVERFYIANISHANAPDFFAPLNTAPASTYTGIDTVETVED